MKIIRPSISSYIILGTLLGFMCDILLLNIYFFIVLFNRFSISIPLIIGLVIFGYLLCLYLISRYRISIDETSISAKKSLFSIRVNSILFPEIMEMKIDIGKRNTKSSFYTLNLMGLGHKVSINLKYFSTKDVVYIAKTIYNFNNKILIDEYVGHLLMCD